MEIVDAFLERADEIIMEYRTAIAVHEGIIRENMEAIMEYEEVIKTYLQMKSIIEA